MSFRLFVWYCMICGAWAGFVGWGLGRILAPSVPPGNTDFGPIVLRTSIVSLFLGFAVAFGLSYLDAIFNLSMRKLGAVFLRVFAAIFVGVLGGLFGGLVGGAIYKLTQWDSIFLISWIIVGFLVGASISFFQLAVSLVTQKDFAGSLKKFIKCLVGGTIGGFIGGIIALLLRIIASKITDKDVEAMWTPTALGFIAIGASIGLLVGLAQVMLKEAWIKVEAGFRPGREMLLMKEKTSIGRAEGSDIALFGDSGVEKSHANIILDAGRYYLEDLQSPGGSFVNEQKVEGRAALKTGDLIRVGKSMLRFNERAKRKD
jgi:hypothetical protein